MALEHTQMALFKTKDKRICYSVLLGQIWIGDYGRRVYVFFLF